MAQVARAHTEAAGGDPRALKRLSVQFRGMGFPEQEIVVTRDRQGEPTTAAWSPTRSPPRETTGSSATPRRSWSWQLRTAHGEAAGRSGPGPRIDLEHALRAPAADPQPRRRRLPRVGEAGRLEGDRRALGHRLEPLDRARRARGARARRLSDPPAYLGGTPAHRLRLSLLRRLAAGLGPPAPGAARARPRSDPDAPRGRRGDARDDRPSCRGSPTCSPSRPPLPPAPRASIASRCCCCSRGW